MTGAKRKGRPSAAQVLEARSRYEAALATLRRDEALWDYEWQAAPNPFVAVQRYLAPEAVARRAPVIAAFVAARTHYEALVRPARRRHADQEEE